MSEFRRSCTLPGPVEQAFAWHERPGAFTRLNPPWEYCEVVEHVGGIRDGARVAVRIGLAGPIKATWRLEHVDYLENRRFRDRQISGPFAAWDHRHLFEPIDETSCRLEDHITHRLPLGPLGRLFGGSMTERKLDRLFAYRHRLTIDDLALHGTFADRPRLRVAITGASGLIGTALSAMLTTGGHEVVRLVRRPARADDEARWDPETGLIDAERLEGVDAVVHLAGEGIADGRWTKERMERIRASRVEGTRRLATGLLGLERPPRTFVCASAIGWYGPRPADEVVTEASTSGEGFLAEVCRAWEAATSPLEDAGIRTTHARFGVVLSPTGGALARMLLPFRLGGGGVLGSGRQMMSWVSLDDAAGAVLRALLDERVRGAINVTAPAPVSNREFTKALGRVLRRPTIVPMPAFAARAAFGPMADEALLTGADVRPDRLEREFGHAWRDPALEPALRRMLGRVEGPAPDAALRGSAATSESPTAAPAT